MYYIYFLNDDTLSIVHSFNTNISQNLGSTVVELKWWFHVLFLYMLWCGVEIILLYTFVILSLFSYSHLDLEAMQQELLYHYYYIIRWGDDPWKYKNQDPRRIWWSYEPSPWLYVFFYNSIHILFLKFNREAWWLIFSWILFSSTLLIIGSYIYCHTGEMVAEWLKR
jgi:hypothetical protein